MVGLEVAHGDGMADLVAGDRDLLALGVLDRLDEAHPGLKNRLVDGDRMASGMAVFVDGAVPTTGLRTKLSPDAEIYFAPAIAGGTGP